MIGQDPVEESDPACSYLQPPHHARKLEHDDDRRRDSGHICRRARRGRHVYAAAAPTWWRRPRRVHGAGAITASLGLLAFLLFWSPPGPLVATVFFYIFSLAATIGGFLTVTSRNPVYSALWFASVVVSTSGLFLLAGAPFLAAGTVIVYAGAIIVTFLFVIMLAQVEGKALYDRASRTRQELPLPVSCCCGPLSTHFRR